MTITADELIDRYEDSVRRNPETAMRMVMWLMLYDQQPASWARGFLQDVGVLATGDTEKTSQLRKIHRWRTAAEEAAGLPPRGKRGATQEYRRALNDWRRLNRRPSKEDLLAGWTPQPLAPPQQGGAGQIAQSPVSENEPTAEKPVTPSAPVLPPAPPEPKISKRAKKIEGEKKPGNETPRLTSEELRKLSQQESEHQRQAFQPKKNEPKPPVFRGTPPPPIKASDEEREEWRRIRKREIADYIVASKEKGWEIPADWDGLAPISSVATWIGPPSA